MRTFNPNDLIKACEQVKDNLHGFYPEEWLSDSRNIALKNEKGDVALFEFFREGRYIGHYFFFSRGKEAVKAAKSFLKEAFVDYDMKSIIGLTPLENKGALWLSSHIGFKKHGTVNTCFGECQLFILTQKEWEMENNNG